MSPNPQREVVSTECAGSILEALRGVPAEYLKHATVHDLYTYLRHGAESVLLGQEVGTAGFRRTMLRNLEYVRKEVPPDITEDVQRMIDECRHDIRESRHREKNSGTFDIAATMSSSDTAFGEPRCIEVNTRSNGSAFKANVFHQSARMEQLMRTAEAVAPKNIPVLITGETGTGKELVARLLHQWSGERSLRSFSAINCAAIPEALLESELFGYKKGAFTGAQSDKDGLFSAAGEGTVFLDEIGEMPPGIQAKLLRVLDSGEFARVGDAAHTIKSRARIVAATNRDLEEAVEQKRFRKDLYYRMGFPVYVPSLAERADVPQLAVHLLRAQNPEAEFDAECLQRIAMQNFPGNVRELQRAIECALVIGHQPNLVRWSELRRFLAE